MPKKPSDEYIAARTGVVLAYETPARAPWPGTCLFLQRAGAFAAITCAHVLRPAFDGEKLREDGAIQIAGIPGDEGVWRFSRIDLRYDDDPSRSDMERRAIDVAFLRISDSRLTDLAGKTFITQEIDTALPSPGELLHYRGFVQELPGCDHVATCAEAPGHIRAVPMFDSPTVMAVNDRTIAVSAPNGYNVSLAGVSGAALFDSSGKIRGLLWGGPSADVLDRIFAIPIFAVLDCFDAIYCTEQQV